MYSYIKMEKGVRLEAYIYKKYCLICIAVREYAEGEGYMISNQILQNTIEGLKTIARVDFCVMDTDGKEAAATTTEMSR